MEKEKSDANNAEVLNSLSAEVDPTKDFFELVIELLKTGLIVFVLALGLRYFVIQPYIVDGLSMFPTYHDKEYLLAEKVSYLLGEPERGDVVVFRYPKNPKVNYIKRIIGLPGETVQIKKNEIIVINTAHPAGFIISEKYLPDDIKTYIFGTDSYEKTLKTDEYFVLGDNREHSADSREWGVLPKSYIAGRSWLTLLPLNRIGFHHRMEYSEDETANTTKNAASTIGPASLSPDLNGAIAGGATGQ